MMDESLDGLLNHSTAWKYSFDAKGLRVNMSRTKMLVRNALAERTVNPSKYSCNVCKKGVGNNSIFFHHGKSYILHCRSNIKGRLRPDLNCKSQKCSQEREITPAPLLKHIVIGNGGLEVVRSFCYLRDVISESGGCYGTTTLRVRSAWNVSRTNPFSFPQTFLPS